jgi:mono/diheme cytochrome c family protein
MVFYRIVFMFLCCGLAACGKERDVTRGATLFAQNCAICHGADLRGGGGAGVAGLNRIPADLTVLTRRAGGTFPRAEVLTILEDYEKGTQPGRKMRPFAHLSADRRRAVRTETGRKRVPRPHADLVAYLEASQRP